MLYSHITEQTILNELHNLTPDKWQEVLKFIQSLKRSSSANVENINLREIMGSCKNIHGDVNQYIDELRDERF